MMDFRQMKALIADIDGTLVTKGEMPGPLTIEALNILHNHGNNWVLLREE